MIKAAFIFGIVSLVPLLTSFMRFKITDSDNEAQVIIKKSMKQTQFGIAVIFALAAIVLLLLSVVIHDNTVANGVTVTLYIVALIGSIAYAVIRQITLQKLINKVVKK
ncbi:MAG: hypothetical protein ACRCV7_01890 [Culicoidibacterales bacterium]